MKLLEIDYNYYQFPQGITTVKEFVEHLSDKYHSFIPMMQYQTDDCVFPYLIQEEIIEVYMNVAKIDKFNEVEATVLCRKDYDSLLDKVVKQKCVNCMHFQEEEDSEGDNLKGHRDKISLDGECWGYDKKTD